MGVQLFRVVFIVSIGLTHVQSNVETDADPSGIQENFRNLFNSMRKNDLQETKNYRSFLELETVREHQAFNTMKEELRPTRRRSAQSQRNLDYTKKNYFGENADVFKREAGPGTTIMRDSTSRKPIIRPDVIETATTPILDDYFYIDKTSFILTLLRDNPTQFFFARPRYFGKTVFLRTLQAAFDRHRQGEVILGGTDISKMNYKWDENKSPVMYFDLSTADLTQSLDQELDRFRRAEKIDTIPEECLYPETSEASPPTVVREFCELLCASGNQTVILIDEYDRSILTHANNPIVSARSENALKSLFSHMKSHAEYIKLAFVTGITRCSFLHMGSDGGDFQDISIFPEYATLAGITEEEIEHYFRPDIMRIAVERNVTPDAIREEAKKWYDNYSFTSAMKTVYNPMSLIRYFRTGVADVYLPREGRASFFWKQVTSRPEDFAEIRENMSVSLGAEAAHVNSARPEALMYEAGYFTIGDVDHAGSHYPHQLRFANEEAKRAFFLDFLETTKNRSCGVLASYIRGIREAITATPEPDFNRFIVTADTAIRSWPFTFCYDDGYSLHLAALMCMAGFNAIPQWNAESAFIDVFDLSSETILLLELKRDDAAGVNEAWEHAERGVDAYLFKQKNVLGAGITPTSRKDDTDDVERDDTVFSGWFAKLYAPNGTLLRSYSREESEWLML